MPMTRCFNLFRLGVILLTFCIPLLVHASEQQNPYALNLRWEVQRSVFSADFPQGRSIASLTLKNIGPQTLPAQGWSVYFNCVAGIDSTPLGGHFTVDRISGTLYRIRPTAQSKVLADGESTQVLVIHPEVMVKIAKGPVGPYIVYDDHPNVGFAITDYQMAPLTRAEQWDHGPLDTAPLITAQMQFDKNADTLDLPVSELPPVFPTPVAYTRLEGKLKWRAMPIVSNDPVLRHEAAFAREMLKPYFQNSSATKASPGLRLALGKVEGQHSVEAYELSVDPQKGVLVTGHSAQAVARGLQSLRELLPLPTPTGEGVVLNAILITDAPRFEYRGFQLDVARNFQSKVTVFRLLDLMARYKLNTFHFHLTDDEGWRLAIDGLPELTAVGARRGHSLNSIDHLQPAYGSGPNVTDPNGSGFYTSADYVEILKYAAARQITVIPEIEMPGHARAAVKAMESRFRRLKKSKPSDALRYLISDLEDQSTYQSAQLYTDHVMNPGVPSTYAFIEKVVTEVARLHRRAGTPLTTLHVGADELPNGAWEKSPATRALMKREKFSDTTEVWDYFYTRVNKILRKQGLMASGWEELGARKVQVRGVGKMIPNPVFTHHGFTLYVWNNLGDSEDLAYRMANAGYRTILVPATHLYFDMAYNKNPDEPGVNWAAYTDLQTVFDFVPFDFVRAPGQDSLTDYGQKNVIGLEGTLFTETVRDAALMDYLLMPRLLGLAERAWAPNPQWAKEPEIVKAKALHQQAWSVFANQLGKVVLPKLNAEFPGIQYRIAPPGLRVFDGKVHANHQTPGVTLRYTVDGTAPTLQSTVMNTPISEKALITVAAFDSTGRKGHPSQLDNR